MSKRKLLLADDSITIQKVVNLTFADEDIDVITVGDGDAAMRKFAEDTPDLVMADVNMPGLDGYRICEMIKRDDETKHIPVVLLVGSFEPFDEGRARQVGANDFLTKPFQSIRQLVNKVSDLLNGANAENEVDSFADTLENIPKPSEPADEDTDINATDDEMIQTEQIGSLPINEPQKSSSNKVSQSSFEDTDIDSIQPPYDFSKSFQNVAQRKNTAENANRNNFHKIESFDEGEDSSEAEDKVSEQLNDDLEQILKNKREFDETGDEFPDFALDDFDLLELPQSRKGAAAKINRQFETDKLKNFARTSFSESFVENTNDISAEFIEAVADKVVEKLSGKVIAEIVRETITQMREEE